LEALEKLICVEEWSERSEAGWLGLLWMLDWKAKRRAKEGFIWVSVDAVEVDDAVKKFAPRRLYMLVTGWRGIRGCRTPATTSSTHGLLSAQQLLRSLRMANSSSR
jgi:hypothetical protein